MANKFHTFSSSYLCMQPVLYNTGYVAGTLLSWSRVVSGTCSRHMSCIFLRIFHVFVSGVLVSMLERSCPCYITHESSVQSGLFDAVHVQVIQTLLANSSIPQKETGFNNVQVLEEKFTSSFLSLLFHLLPFSSFSPSQSLSNVVHMSKILCHLIL